MNDSSSIPHMTVGHAPWNNDAISRQSKVVRFSRALSESLKPYFGQQFVSPQLHLQLEMWMQRVLDSMGIPATMISVEQDPEQTDVLHVRARFQSPLGAPNPLWGEVTVSGDKLHYRHDFPEYDDAKSAQEEYYLVQEMLRPHGWELVEPQIEHNCVSGYLVRIA